MWNVEYPSYENGVSLDGYRFKTGITFSCWDLLHPGHVMFLNSCLDRCDSLYVGLHSDPSVERPEKQKPAQTLLERFMQLRNVFRNENISIIPYSHERDIIQLLKILKPEVRFLGSDYVDKPVTGLDLTPSTMYIERNHDFSSSELKNRIKNT